MALLHPLSRQILRLLTESACCSTVQRQLALEEPGFLQTLQGIYITLTCMHLTDEYTQKTYKRGLTIAIEIASLCAVCNKKKIYTWTALLKTVGLMRCCVYSN